MDKNTILVAVIALLSGFIGGFLVANSQPLRDQLAALFVYHSIGV